jgi:adenine-specific DNA-methyltransferase
MKPLTANDPESKTPDLAAGNLAKLKALFPEVVAEDGVNVDALKQLIGKTVTDTEEKYGLNWHGKRRARQLALTPSTGTLRPCPGEYESVNWDTTRNLMIEGDNLEVLKLLQKSYAGKVKLIYIDPPYNTGKDFVYPDNFQDNIKNYLEITGQVEGGQKIGSNVEASGRFHTDWLTMMYPRIKLARNLLADDGVIFCSIDDVESPRLRIVLDEVFGEENFLAQFSWRTDGNFDNQAKIKNCHEYIVMYAKSVDDFPHPPVVDPSTPKDSKLFRPEIRNTIVKNGPKNPVSKITLPIGFPADFDDGRINKRNKPWPIYFSEAIVEGGKLTQPTVIESGWSSKELIMDFINGECKPIIDGKGQETSFVISNSGAIEAVKRRSDCQSHVISVLNGFGGSQKATAQLEEMGALFNGYPKPIELIQYLVQMTSDRDAIVLDFFAGSGPIGHAVMAQNASDSGRRRYVLVQLPEPLDPNVDEQKKAANYCDKIGKPRNIAELTKERLRRAGKKIRKENPMFAGDIGFRVFKLASSNIQAWEPDRERLAETLEASVDHLKTDRTESDILFELLLKLGLDLTVPIETRTIAGQQVHSIGAGTLLVCLSKSITAKEVEPLALGIAAWHKTQAPAGESTIVFRDSAFADDVAKTNLTAILQQHGLENVRSL